MRKTKLPVKVNANILNGIESKSWPFSDEIVSVSYSKNEANGQNIFVLQDHDFKAEGWKTFIAYDEIHTNMARLCNFHIFDQERGLTPSGASRPAGEPKVLHLSFLFNNF